MYSQPLKLQIDVLALKCMEEGKSYGLIWRKLSDAMGGGYGSLSLSGGVTNQELGGATKRGLAVPVLGFLYSVELSVTRWISVG